jgi:uncharacterized protein (TIGR02611 family)
MATAGEPQQPEDDHRPFGQRLREAAIEAEYDTGVREDTEEQAKASIHVRLARMTLGTLLLVAGVLMLALPGPGWLTIAAGLAILAKDVAWAERLLERVRRRLPEGEDGEVDRRVIVVSIIIAIVAIGASVWWYFIR